MGRALSAIPDLQRLSCCEDSVKNKFIYTNVLKGYKIENNRWLSGVEATNGE
jgi:hypothetical protein